MPDNDDDGLWAALPPEARVELLRADIRAMRKEIDGFKKWLMNGALAALGILAFQALPYLQMIAKGAGK